MTAKKKIGKVSTKPKDTKKLTAKQEAFCIEYLKCGNASEAYRIVYSCRGSNPETINRAAKTLMDSPKIAARISELQANVAKQAELTATDIVKELEEARTIAKADDQPSSMVSASMGKAKVMGLIVDKSEIDLNVKTKIDFAKLDPKELGIFRLLLAKIRG